MPKPCDCRELHQPKRVVLTGGPGAGKTAILELIRHFFCEHVYRLPEAAGIVFGGGFPRDGSVIGRQAAQRAIFHVQRELEVTATEGNHAIVLCDRATVDGAAYWRGSEDFWQSAGTTREAELARYEAVIHLRTPQANNGYDRSNVLRLETASEAVEIDRRIASAWAGHPRCSTIGATVDFLEKAAKAIDLLRAELPLCCRHHATPLAIGSPAAP